MTFKFDNDSELYDFINDRLSRLNRAGFDLLNYCCEDEYSELIADFYDDVCQTIGAVWYKTGATKLVLNFYEFPDVVFKIPFKGVKTFEWDESAEEWSFVEIQDFDNAGVLSNDRTCDDYCDTEEYLYEEACNEGLEEFFTPIQCLGAICDNYIYVSKRVDADFYGKYLEKYSSEIGNTNKYSAEVARLSETYDDCDMSSLMLSVFIFLYGIKKVTHLMNFINDKGMSDFHSYNVGWVPETGLLQILDYSGYFE